ncbi:hypothetical protein L3X38_036576 [Prunus dulcis]|uniref:Uncharacterized protein n=1 Tax=Prunus dulcis TaxID=3755 RepID=A0AAD4YPV9_PRUDU|nr:hypothetical protein L3X38_036576 [Prunus dulcis]
MNSPHPIQQATTPCVTEPPPQSPKLTPTPRSLTANKAKLKILKRGIPVQSCIPSLPASQQSRTAHTQSSKQPHPVLLSHARKNPTLQLFSPLSHASDQHLSSGDHAPKSLHKGETVPLPPALA